MRCWIAAPTKAKDYCWARERLAEGRITASTWTEVFDTHHLAGGGVEACDVDECAQPPPPPDGAAPARERVIVGILPPWAGRFPQHFQLGRLPDPPTMSHRVGMALDVLQRFAWDGRPTEIGIPWTLQKRGHRACCRVVTHLLGFEIWLDVDGDLARSDVCRSLSEVETTQAQWCEALEGKGWENDLQSR